MAISVSEALDYDNCLKLVVERTEKGKYVDGIYKQGTTSTFKTLISPQQPTPEQLEILPEGERDKDIMMFISKRKLRTTDDKAEIIADVILFDEKRYKIISLANWSTFGHNIAYGARQSNDS